MEQMNRTEGLRALIRQGLQAVAHKDTLAHLGDRSSYIGMSDIGQHWECHELHWPKRCCPPQTAWSVCLRCSAGTGLNPGLGKL